MPTLGPKAALYFRLLINLFLLAGVLAGPFTKAVAQGGSTVTLPSATVGTAYEIRLSLDGMVLAAPATMAIDSNGKPAWLNFDPATGLITGTPTAPPQSSMLTVVITDANAKVTRVTAKLTVNAVAQTPAAPNDEVALPDVYPGVAYQAQLPLPPGGTLGSPLPSLPNSLVVSSAGLISGTVQPGGNIEGDYRGTASVSAGGNTSPLRFKFKLYLTPPIVKIYTLCFVPADKRPIITATVSDLTTTIAGLAIVPPGCAATMAVWSVDPATNSGQNVDVLGVQPGQSQLLAAHANAVQIKSGATVAADGTFALQLSSPPRAGQTLVLEERLTDASQNQVASFFSTPIPVHFAGDWGRVKTYFTSGILMSQDQGSFSQSSLFLSFLMDKAWVLPRPVYGQSRGVPGFNTFFETRLTSVPVTAQPCPTANTSTTGQCSGTSSDNTDQFNTFLTSQKSARLAVGAYLPFIAKLWTYNGVRNALFVAPLAKIGFDTPVSAINQSQAQGQSSNSGNPSDTPIVAVNDSNFYNFYVYGARIGHESLPSPEVDRNSPILGAWSVNEAPEVNSYLDIAVGRFSNLQTLLSDGNHTRLYRISLEGILKVPSTPLVIGFSANLGQTSVGVNTTNISRRAADDLRFLIGAKFDVGKITSYLTNHAF
ncbi:MAG: Ig domain-containing protein [Acidobacteriia bacterium]|nr:Ig domain-containing protein [Terriglobia bacterium]